MLGGEARRVQLASQDLASKHSINKLLRKHNFPPLYGYGETLRAKGEGSSIPAKGWVSPLTKDSKGLPVRMRQRDPVAIELSENRAWGQTMTKMSHAYHSCHRPCPLRVNMLSLCNVEQAHTVWAVYPSALNVLLTPRLIWLLNENYIFPEITRQAYFSTSVILILL